MLVDSWTKASVHAFMKTETKKNRVRLRPEEWIRLKERMKLNKR